MEGGPAVDADAEVLQQAYLEELARHRQELQRLARSQACDIIEVDSHASVGPPLAALLSRREALWRARRSS
jgi:hypothetical protein